MHPRLTLSCLPRRPRFVACLDVVSRALVVCAVLGIGVAASAAPRRELFVGADDYSQNHVCRLEAAEKELQVRGQ